MGGSGNSVDSRLRIGPRHVNENVDAAGRTPLQYLLTTIQSGDGRGNTAATERNLEVCKLLADVADLDMKAAAQVEGESERTLLDYGCDMRAISIRDMFIRLRHERELVKRSRLFLRTVASGNLKPWSLGVLSGVSAPQKRSELQAWLRTRTPLDAKSSLKKIVDAMSDIDGLSLLSKCVDLGLDGRTKNFLAGKFSKVELDKMLGCSCLQAALPKLEQLFGSPEEIGYYRIVLLSCNRRSPLTDFRWKSSLGKGSFGRVHGVVNRHSGQGAAIKILMPKTIEDMDRATEEVGAISIRSNCVIYVTECAHAQTRLQQKLAATSEHVVTVISWGAIYDDKFLYVVMELCQGTLHDRIEPLRGMTDILLRDEWIRQLAGVLVDLRNMQIIHRDIKPEVGELFRRAALSTTAQSAPSSVRLELVFLSLVLLVLPEHPRSREKRWGTLCKDSGFRVRDLLLLGSPDDGNWDSPSCRGRLAVEVDDSNTDGMHVALDRPALWRRKWTCDVLTASRPTCGAWDTCFR